MAVYLKLLFCMAESMSGWRSPPLKGRGVATAGEGFLCRLLYRPLKITEPIISIITIYFKQNFAQPDLKSGGCEYKHLQMR
jgi:hypothetical protein